MDPRTEEQLKSLIHAGQYAQARAMLARLLQRSPNEAGMNNLMAVVFVQEGKAEQALYFAQRASDAIPSNVMLKVNLATCMVAAAKPEKAIEVFRAALAVQPANTDASLGLMNALTMRSRYGEAAQAARHALQHQQNDPLLFFGAAAPLMHSGRGDEATALLRKGLALNPSDPLVRTRLAATMLYDPTASAEDLTAAHVDAATAIAGTVAPPPPQAKPSDADRPLRIGVLSSDLREHAVARFITPLLERLDKQAFHITCYHNERMEDKESERLKKLVPAWRNIAALSEPDAAAAIRSDKIDILIETMGLSGRHCQVLLLLKPAPILVSWLGYPSVTALPTIDYRIVDSLTDPPGVERPHTEELIRLDPCFLCFPRPAQPPPARPKRDQINFGCFNTIQKVNDPLLRTWAKILNAIPNSRIILKSTGLDDATLQQDLRERMAAAGIDPTRADIRGITKTYADHLAMYADVDIALDTFPYCGTTTTCEALCMGTPVISRAGTTHHSRVGLSLLTCVGHPELCVADEQSYIIAAIALAKDPPRLEAFHRDLPEQVASSPLCDQTVFATRFGETLRLAWRELCVADTN